MNSQIRVRSRSGRRAIALVAVAGLLVAACGDDDEGADDTAAAETASDTAAAATEAPATEAPATDAPASSASATDAPESSASATDAPAALPADAPEWMQQLEAMKTMSLEELHQKAVEEEGGEVVFWNGNSVIPEDRAGMGPRFEAAFPGMAVTLYGEGSTDEMVAKVVAEKQAGVAHTGDLFWASYDYGNVSYDEGIVWDWAAGVPEAEPYPDDLKGSFFIVVDYTFHGIAWNTNNVSEDEEPTSFQDLLDPKWKDRIVAEPRIATQLTALSDTLFASQEEAQAYVTALAEQNVTFVPRYPTVAEQLAAGEHDICFNCNAYNTADLIAEGAPLKWMSTETMALPDLQMMFEDPPHPYGAMLMARWLASEEGQQGFVAGKRNAALPGVPAGDTLPADTLYILTRSAMVDLFPTWSDFVDETFNLR